MIVSKNKEANTDPWKSGRRKPCDSCRDKYALRRGIYSVEYCKIAGARTPLFFRSVIPSAGQTNITRVALEDALRTFVFFSLKIFQRMQGCTEDVLRANDIFLKKQKENCFMNVQEKCTEITNYPGRFTFAVSASPDALFGSARYSSCEASVSDNSPRRSRRTISSRAFGNSFIRSCARSSEKTRVSPTIWIHPGLKRDESREISRH